jgi:hypothetical protein
VTEAQAWTSEKVLSRAECLTFLSGRSSGRVAVSRRALPAILPVAYTLLHDEVVFALATGPDGPVGLDENVVAFQVDNFTSLTGGGSSVTVVGVARQLDKRDPEWSQIGDLGPRQGPDDPPVDLFRLSTRRISGQMKERDQ